MAVTTFLSLLLLVISPVFFQERENSTIQSGARDEDVIKLNSRLVNLNVQVTDRAGRTVSSLKREDFIVLEDGKQQTVAYFEPVIAPVNLVLLIDLSGSLGSKTEALKSAAKKFIDSLGKDDLVAVATFTTRFDLVSNLTGDRKRLKKRIDQIRDPAGDTSFYDSMWATLDLIGDVQQSRKAIVVLTDGVDSSHIPGEHGSSHSFSDLLMRVVEEDATVYPIYFDTEPEVVGGNYTHEIFASARRQLETLAGQTGGTYFKASRTEDLEGVYERVSAELHRLYSLAYHPKDAHNDGRWRRISVKINREGLVAKTRRGYYAK